jgi:hypothetical protein
MPATATAPRKTRKSGPTPAAEARCKKAVGEVEVSLEKTRAALDRMRADLGRDSKRIARDVEKLVRTAQRDAAKLSRAIRSDIER